MLVLSLDLEKETSSREIFRGEANQRDLVIDSCKNGTRDDFFLTFDGDHFTMLESLDSGRDLPTDRDADAQTISRALWIVRQTQFQIR